MKIDTFLIHPSELCNRIRNNKFSNKELSDYIDWLKTLPRHIRGEYVREIERTDILNNYESRTLLALDLNNEVTRYYWEWQERWLYVREQLAKVMTSDAAEGLRLPDALNTDRARKYFARAVEAQFMELTPTGGKWLKPLARLGYLCLKIYPQPRPITDLKKFFGMTNDLSAAITQASFEAKRADVIKWRDEIDKNIFFD